MVMWEGIQLVKWTFRIDSRVYITFKYLKFNLLINLFNSNNNIMNFKNFLVYLNLPKIFILINIQYYHFTYSSLDLLIKEHYSFIANFDNYINFIK